MATKPDTKAATEPAAEPVDEKVDEKDEQAVFRLMERLKGKEKQLHAKLADVMVIAERIPKNGTAPQAMGSFKFVQVGDAADFIRRALGRRNVSMVPSRIEPQGKSEHASGQGGSKTMTTLELLVTWTLTDADTGETAVIQSYGAGADTGDKFTGKAMSNAMKYAFLAGFLLSTGDDVELGDTSDRQPQRPAPTVTRSTGRVPAQGGKQTEGTVPQRRIMGELLRKLGSGTPDKAIPVINELTGKTFELGEDKPASLMKALDTLTANESGKLIHDLQKRVEALAQPAEEAAAETTETADAGTESNPDAPAGEAPDDSLEAGSAL